MPPRKNQPASRKMAKKGGPASFQAEVNSDEEWKFILQKVGLVVVDVYSDWCGPCVGMMSNLKKVKLELGNEYLHLVMANADKIRALERFRGTSEPTWVFIARPFHEPTPEEVQKQEEINAKKRAEEEEEKREKEEQMEKVKRRYLERVARKTIKQSVLLYFPHTIEISDPKTKKKVCQPAYKMMALYDQIDMSIKDQLEIQLTKETIPEVFYNSGMVLPKALLKVMEEQPCMASLIQEYDIPVDEDDEPETRESRAQSHVGVVERKLATLSFGNDMDPFKADPETVCAEFMLTTPKGVRVPPFWTPNNHLSKAAALEVLFPYVVKELKIEMEKLPPPALVLIFEATRAREILDAAQPYAEDILHVGYFDSMDPASATKICQTVWEVDKFPEMKIAELKMVVALQKLHSEPMLVLAQLNPLYMSADGKQGMKETEMFFPPSIEEEAEADPFSGPPVVEHDDGEFLEDEDGNRYREEYVEVDGETVLKKRVIRLADGTGVDLLIDLSAKVEYIPEEGDGKEEAAGEVQEGHEEKPVEEEGEKADEPDDEGPRPMESQDD